MREMLNEFTGKGGDYVSQQGTTSTSRTPFPSHRSPPKLLGLNTWINIILKLYQKCAKGVLGSCPTPSPNVVTHLGYRGNVSSTPDLSAHVNVSNGWRVGGGVETGISITRSPDNPCLSKYQIFKFISHCIFCIFRLL